MAWKKGQSGNPAGGPKDKLFADAVRMAINEIDPVKGIRKLRLIAEKLVEEAINGESWAIQQVADRIDGKPAQESTVIVDDKRSGEDWARNELVAFLNDARTRGNGAAKANGSSGGADSVH